MPDARRTGIATELSDALRARAATDRVARSRIGALAENLAAAEAVYRKRGFEPYLTQSALTTGHKEPGA